MSAHTQTSIKAPATSTSTFTPVPSRLLQRKCACGGTPGMDGECEECRQKRLSLQRRATNQAGPATVPPIVHDVLRSPGQPLDGQTRAFMEPRFGHNFSQVRVHTDARAGESARAVNALAYTVGRELVFGAGQYAPRTMEGRKLLAHELVHVVQQSASLQRNTLRESIQNLDSTPLEQAERQAHDIAEHILSNQVASTHISYLGSANHLQREQLGSKVTHTRKSNPFHHITANFDGQDFVVMGDKHEILRAAAESGRPISVRARDARACGGSTDDSYKNNPRYVGIADNGPIPEGEYQFSVTSMAVFTAWEQARMITGGDYTDPFGSSLHGGDWGAGRVALNPVTLLPSRFCGSTRTRSGFFLHGGVLPGSSGCIDIGNNAYKQLVDLLNGYRAPIHVFVKYTHAAPEVGTGERAVGRFTYPSTGGHNPSVWDRLKSLVGKGSD